MGRSSAEPSLRMSAGARLMVTMWVRGKIEAAIAQRGVDALAAFFHRDVREADDGEMTFEGGRNVDFDFDQIGVDAEDGGAECLE